jgi:hypothetical protein
MPPRQTDECCHRALEDLVAWRRVVRVVRVCWWQTKISRVRSLTTDARAVYMPRKHENPKLVCSFRSIALLLITNAVSV